VDEIDARGDAVVQGNSTVPDRYTNPGYVTVGVSSLYSAVTTIDCDGAADSGSVTVGEPVIAVVDPNKRLYDA
jgi:hypothetical protein